MSRWPSSAFAVDYYHKAIEQKGDARFPPRIPLTLPAEGQDYDSMVAKWGRPFGAFERERRHPYCAAPVTPVSRWEDGL
jgi:hypothetical protein